MEENKQKAPTEIELNANFDRLLKEFNTYWEEGPDVGKIGLLIEKAKITPLTPRQTQAIVDRCKNVLAGQYGNTKKPENYEQAKPQKVIPPTNGKAKN